MAANNGRTFSGTTEVLDHNEYSGCTFENCTLVYRGGPTALKNNTFQNCRWTFEDSAGRTLEFLRALAQGSGPAAQKMVKDTLGLN